MTRTRYGTRTQWLRGVPLSHRRSDYPDFGPGDLLALDLLAGGATLLHASAAVQRLHAPAH